VQIVHNRSPKPRTTKVFFLTLFPKEKGRGVRDYQPPVNSSEFLVSRRNTRDANISLYKMRFHGLRGPETEHLATKSTPPPRHVAVQYLQLD